MNKTKQSEADRVFEILAKAGDSNAASRNAVLDFHGGRENMEAAARLWSTHHMVLGMTEEDVFVAYATAVDLGYRIAQSGGVTIETGRKSLVNL